MKRINTILVCLFMTIGSFSFGQDKLDFKEVLKQAEDGNDFAQYALSIMYFTGDGVSKDYNKAFYWWQKSVEKGYAPSQYSLGVNYFILRDKKIL